MIRPRLQRDASTPLSGAQAAVLAQPPVDSPALVAALRPAREPHPLYDASKRLADVSLGLVLLAASLPLLALACLLIAATSRRSPILLQRRVGLLGREFTMLKLRTMRTEPAAEGGLPDDKDGILVGKTYRDPRVTGIGRFLRRTSIDELPQLFNVLAGSMSLVGPRPGLPVEYARYPYSWRRRLSVKPGMTGLWQVSGRSEVPPRRRVAMDRYYVRRRSTRFDHVILVRTVVATLSMRGAW